jgi:dTDP-glucose 4,6-dehydratase/UDP-glucose 4-epimerase
MITKNLKILVIGCNGFIGSHTYQFFISKAYEVYGADRNGNDGSIFKLNHDLTNLEVLFQSNSFDVCINASGSATVAFSMQNEQADYLLNYKNVELLLNAVKVHQPQCKFINLSSAAVYGNPRILPITEETATNPISPYGKHKLLSEQLLLEGAQKVGLKTTSLRIFSVYGNGLKKQLFWDIFQKAQKSTSIELYGTGNETRDFIHIDDLMLAFEKIILHGIFDGSVLNVASGNESTIKLAAETLIQYLNPKVKVNFNGMQNNADPSHWKADISRLKNLGFLPQVVLKAGLKKYALWLKELN